MKLFLNSRLTLLLAAMAFTAGFSTTASAYVVNTSIGTYDAMVLTTPPNPQAFEDIELILMSQVWWGDQNLTIEFATAISHNLGLTSGGGPSFAYNSTLAEVQGCNWALGPIQCGTQPRDVEFNWVVATEVTTVPVPTAAWLFMSGFIGLTGLARRKM